MKVEKQQRLRGTGPQQQQQPRLRPRQRGGARPLGAGEEEDEEDVVVLRLEQSDGEIRYIAVGIDELLSPFASPPLGIVTQAIGAVIPCYIYLPLPIFLCLLCRMGGNWATVTGSSAEVRCVLKQCLESQLQSLRS